MKNNKIEKPKRIKKVFSNHSEVLHRWANQTQNEARCSNVFFDGPTCYSYGRHYPLGLITEYRGVKMAVINGRGYSNTTDKHINSAYHACNGLMPVVRGESSDFSAKGIFNALLSEQQKLIEGIMATFNMVSARSWAIDRFDKDSWITNNLKAFNKKAIDLKEPQLVIDLCKDGFIEYLKEHLKLVKDKTDAREALKNSPEVLAKKEADRLAREAKTVEKGRADILAWRSFEKPSLTNEAHTVLGRGAILRVKDNTVFTSNGASVPLTHAVRLLDLIENKKAKDGERIGEYRFNSAKGGEIVIGCNRIALSEARAVVGPYMASKNLKLVTNGEV